MLKLKRNPDDRRDNVENQRAIDNTVRNMRAPRKCSITPPTIRCGRTSLKKMKKAGRSGRLQAGNKDEADYRESRRAR